MKKNKELLIILIILVGIARCVLLKNMNNLDEIWNYNFAINIANENLPYKDFNMVQTPLSVFISGIALKVFGNELIVMRILGIVLCTAIWYVLYKILRKLEVSECVIYTALLLLWILHSAYFTYDYNYLVLLITLITIYFELNDNIIKANKKKDLLLRDFGRGKYFSQTNYRTYIKYSIYFL